MTRQTIGSVELALKHASAPKRFSLSLKIREIALEKLNMEIGEPRVMSLSLYG